MPSLSIYNTATGAANIGGLHFSCLFERAEILIPVNKCECPQRLNFSPGNLFWGSFTNHNTENYLRHDINVTTNERLSQHSGETGTRLSWAIHRRLLSRFFLREGRRLYTGYFLRCLHGFCFVYISRFCRLRWPEELYFKFYFLQAFKFAELKLQV